MLFREMYNIGDFHHIYYICWPKCSTFVITNRSAVKPL